MNASPSPIEYSFDAEIWLYEGQAGWHFVTLPHDLATSIRETAEPSSPFGSLRVRAQIRDVSFETSIFPDRESSSYLLPIRKTVRAKAGLCEGEVITVTLMVVGKGPRGNHS